MTVPLNKLAASLGLWTTVQPITTMQTHHDHHYTSH